jgi:hypothetical protein
MDKKTTKNKKDPMTKLLGKKIVLVSGHLDLTAILKGPWSCPLNHMYLLIRALRPNFDLLSIHIERFSNILRRKVTKKGYYNG